MKTFSLLNFQFILNIVPCSFEGRAYVNISIEGKSYEAYNQSSNKGSNLVPKRHDNTRQVMLPIGM